MFYTLKDTNDLPFGTILPRDDYYLIKLPHQRVELVDAETQVSTFVHDTSYGFFKLSEYRYVFFEQDALDVYNPQ